MRCPYPNCRKDFDRFLMFIDEFNKVFRETYYACPHCKSRVDVIITSEDALELSKGKKTLPSNFVCPYYFGYLSSFPKKPPIPETCLTCTQITECMTRNI